ncbi:MAG TPA: LysM domain-containing protein [Candidatus Paceibacterota bacterium]
MRTINKLGLSLVLAIFPVVSFGQSFYEQALSKPESMLLELITYEVKYGDNMTKIAHKFDLKVEEITNPEINPSMEKRDPDLIFPGELLNIPLYKPRRSADAQDAARFDPEVFAVSIHDFTKLNSDINKLYVENIALKSSLESKDPELLYFKVSILLVIIFWAISFFRNFLKFRKQAESNTASAGGLKGGVGGIMKD